VPSESTTVAVIVVVCALARKLKLRKRKERNFFIFIISYYSTVPLQTIAARNAKMNTSFLKSVS